MPSCRSVPSRRPPQMSSRKQAAGTAAAQPRTRPTETGTRRRGRQCRTRAAGAAGRRTRRRRTATTPTPAGRRRHCPPPDRLSSECRLSAMSARQPACQPTRAQRPYRAEPASRGRAHAPSRPGHEKGAGGTRAGVGKRRRRRQGEHEKQQKKRLDASEDAAEQVGRMGEVQQGVPQQKAGGQDAGHGQPAPEGGPAAEGRLPGLPLLSARAQRVRPSPAAARPSRRSQKTWKGPRSPQPPPGQEEERPDALVVGGRGCRA